MSNDKEFEKTKIKSEIYQRSFGYILNFEDRGITQDAFSTAWDYQQKIINKKDEEIERLKKVNEMLRIMDKSYKLNWARDRETIDKKDAEIERYKKALSVYANTHNWINGFFVADNFYSEKEEGYELAQQVLSEVENELHN